MVTISVASACHSNSAACIATSSGGVSKESVQLKSPGGGVGGGGGGIWLGMQQLPIPYIVGIHTPVIVRIVLVGHLQLY